MHLRPFGATSTAIDFNNNGRLLPEALTPRELDRIALNEQAWKHSRPIRSICDSALNVNASIFADAKRKTPRAQTDRGIQSPFNTHLWKHRASILPSRDSGSSVNDSTLESTVSLKPPGGQPAPW
jgi:hypothetical protein